MLAETWLESTNHKFQFKIKAFYLVLMAKFWNRMFLIHWVKCFVICLIKPCVICEKQLFLFLLFSLFSHTIQIMMRCIIHERDLEKKLLWWNKRVKVASGSSHVCRWNCFYQSSMCLRFVSVLAASVSDRVAFLGCNMKWVKFWSYIFPAFNQCFRMKISYSVSRVLPS